MFLLIFMTGVLEMDVNIFELVNSQKSFFMDVNKTDVVVWEKESQFAIQSLQNNKFLAEAAEKNKASLQNAIINIAAIGISLNPALKHAYLVPRKNTDKIMCICLDISYMGLLSLAIRTGSIEWGQSKIVYEKDTYENNGIGEKPTHKQNTFGIKGKIIGVYCVVKTKSGDYLTEEMDLPALEKVQKTSKAEKGPWKTWWEEMIRKTVIKRASKYWPKSEELGKAIVVLDDQEGLSDFSNEKDLVESINADQEKSLLELIILAGMTEDMFCNHKIVKISSLSCLPVARYKGAVTWVKKLMESKNENN